MKKFQYALVFCSFLIAVLAQVKTPSLTDAQKLKIRSAQVEMFQAKTNLEATTEFRQFQAAQKKLNDTVNSVVKESGVDPKEFNLGQDLEFTPAPKPAEKR